MFSIQPSLSVNVGTTSKRAPTQHNQSHKYFRKKRVSTTAPLCKRSRNRTLSRRIMSTHYTFIPLLTSLLYTFPPLPLKRQYPILAYRTNELESLFCRKPSHVPAFIFSRNKQISAPPLHRCGLQPPPRLQPTVCVTSLISPTVCWLGARCRRSWAFWQIQTASVGRGLSQGLTQYG